MKEIIYKIYKPNLITKTSNVGVISLIQIEELNKYYWSGDIEEKLVKTSMGIKSLIL